MTTEHDIEAYKEVIDILGSRIKKTDEINAQLMQSIVESKRKIAFLEDALLQIKESAAYSPRSLRVMADDALTEAKQLNDIQNNHP
jgi:predicted RNase H-like nuclease (RuvC/YqgF family)